MPSIDPAGRDAFGRAFDLLDRTDPDAIRAVERACDLELVGRGTTRLAFDASAHVEGGSAVVKVAIDRRGGVRATEREATTWDGATDDQRSLLAPVLAIDPDCRWLVMPSVETGVSPARAREFHVRLTDAGLVFRDLTPGDVGVLDGDPVLVDYAGCRPVGDARVSVEEMRALVARRWDDW